MMPRQIAGSQLISPITAASWAAGGSGWPPPTKCSSQGCPGMLSDQDRPEAAYSQPIGLASRRKLNTSPTVAYPRGKTSA
jgi:hypothetical protein